MLVTIPHQCPNCRASLPEQAAFCPACGTRLAYPQETASEGRDLGQLVENANQALEKSGAGAAEFAFGASCSLAIILIVGLLLVLFLLGVREWTTLGIVSLVAVLVGTLAAVFLARRARNANITSTYNKVVQPEIDNFLRENRLTRQEFDEQAAALVAPDEPLGQYLSRTPALDSEA